MSLDKSRYNVRKVEYLGYVFSDQTVSMSLIKVQEVLSLAAPKNVHDVLVFMGFANLYEDQKLDGSRSSNYRAHQKRPQTLSLREKTSRRCCNYEEVVYNSRDPLPLCPGAADRSRDRHVGLRSRLCPLSDDRWRATPGSLPFTKFNSPELNHEIHDQELMAIVIAFKK